MKSVLVTGASSGFGRDVVTALLGRGFRVVAAMRAAAARRSLFAEELARYAGALEIVELDVTCAAERDAVVALAEARGLDGLVNNAGYGLFGALEDVSEAQLRDQMEVNFFGLALLTKALLPTLRRSRGFIVNLSSSFGTTAFPLTSAYCASKFAVEGFSEALYHELGPHGVRVHIVEPGGHRTRFAANTRWGEGSEGAYAARTRAYRALHARLSSGAGTPPDAVVRAIVDLAVNPRSLLRVQVGRDARALGALRALLPDVVALPVLRYALGRLLPAGESAGASAFVAADDAGSDADGDDAADTERSLPESQDEPRTEGAS